MTLSPRMVSEQKLRFLELTFNKHVRDLVASVIALLE